MNNRVEQLAAHFEKKHNTVFSADNETVIVLWKILEAIKALAEAIREKEVSNGGTHNNGRFGVGTHETD